MTFQKMMIFILSMILVLIALSGCTTYNSEKKAPPIGQVLNVGGEKIHVVDTGSKTTNRPPIVLIHGASANLRDMKIALGDALAKDHRVIMIDRPGRGYSSRPAEGHRLDLQARYIRWTLDALGVENPIVVGQSFGGAVALAYALQYQSEMSGLVVLAPVSHEWPGRVALYSRISETPFVGSMMRRMVLPVYGELAGDAAVAAAFKPGEPPADYQHQSGVGLFFRPKDFRANASDIANLKTQIIEQQNHYGALTLPVAIIVGELDEAVNPELHSKRLAKEISQSTLTVLPGVGHTLNHAEPEKIISIINEMSAAAPISATEK